MHKEASRKWINDPKGGKPVGVEKIKSPVHKAIKKAMITKYTKPCKAPLTNCVV
jgi:hypothetical protein